MLMNIGPVLVIGGRVDWSCMQAGIGLEGCRRTIAACGHNLMKMFGSGRIISLARCELACYE